VRLCCCVVLAVGCADPRTTPTTLRPERTTLPAAPQSWRPANAAPFAAAAPVLLTDGTVMVQELDTEHWWKLTPDEKGGYENGTWKQLASMQSGYSPLYTATGVLPDGRVIVEGGEYIAGNMAFSKDGALYDPLADSWTAVHAPDGWGMIGDASGLVLANGQFMLSSCCTDQLALFEPASSTWIPVGQGKRDINDEESWTQLWDNTIFVIDTNNLVDLKQAEIYHPNTGMWMSIGDTPIQISDTKPDNSGSHEIGPAVMMPSGDVFALGGNGHQVIFHPSTQTFDQAPDLPMNNGQLDVADGAAAMLPNGNVLFVASVGVFGMPTFFFEYDGTAYNEASRPPNARFNSSYNNFMLMLPTGEVLLTDFSNDVELYTPAPGVTPQSVPVITAAPALVGDAVQPLELTPVATLLAGHTYVLEADRINGISQGAYYGDDMQAYTNFPIVRIANTETGHVRYCRTHDHGSRAIGPDTHGATQFDVPADLDRGPATLETIANGIASPPIEVNIR
jgi:hypothetical protein